MKQKLTGLSQRYVTALRKHLRPGSRASLQPALELGRQAATLGLETLELSRIHERALATLELSKGKNGVVKRAEIFFNEAITPIVETHRAARQTKVHLSRLKEMLGQRTEELAATNRQLQRGVVRRKVMEDVAEKSGQHHHKSLEESLQLQKRLRQLTHQVLAAQEDERKNISRELQDKIAQTLLGINVRLLSLKQEARSNHNKGLKNEIASTQRLVVKSAKSVQQFARELDIHQPAQSDPSVTALGRKLRVEELKVERSISRAAQLSTFNSQLVPASPAGCSFPVIAMAASAGGLKALSVILGSLPADFPAAIAIVMHLAPDHKSILAEILNSRSHLEVKQAHTGDSLCPANVFIAPPNHHLFVAKGGRLKLSSSAAEKVHYARPSAEPLFASVAEVYKTNAIAVVLTGGDGDGSFGVQIIKEQGGQVIAQDRPTSQDFSMPETSIKTGDVDFILPLNEIAPKLIELVGAGKAAANGRTTAKKRMNKPALQNLRRRTMQPEPKMS
ncbi:MAG TPA: chemotaxis protein CheB [Candidatus Limnocylindrales bacterium]|nr:chemotaxis protein CheB [Candidatus Limnocylindrales bacterium]